MTRVRRIFFSSARPSLIHQTQPYVSCFENKMEEEAFHIAANGFSLNLPSNISSFIPGVELDLERQIDHYMALASSLAHKCQERTGAEIAYMGIPVFHNCGSVRSHPFPGTEAVARDIDTLSRLIEGEDKPINCQCLWSVGVCLRILNRGRSLGLLLRHDHRTIPCQDLVCGPNRTSHHRWRSEPDHLVRIS
jgi:hypothetical protein